VPFLLRESAGVPIRHQRGQRGGLCPPALQLRAGAQVQNRLLTYRARPLKPESPFQTRNLFLTPQKPESRNPNPNFRIRQASRVANSLEELHARITSAVDKYLTPALLKVQRNSLHKARNLLHQVRNSSHKARNVLRKFYIY